MADDDVLILRGKGETLPKQPLDPYDVTVDSLLASPTQAGDGAALLAFLGHGEEEEGRLYLLKMHRGRVAWKLVSADLTEVPCYNDAIHIFCVKVPQSSAPEAQNVHLGVASNREFQFKKVNSQFDEGNNAKDFCVLDYPEEFCSLTKAKEPFKTLVRECYKEIWKKVETIQCGKVVIMGNPGIGKSSLLLYASVEQALAGQKVYLICRYLSEEDATNREVFCFDSAKEEDGKVTVACRVGPLTCFAQEIGRASNALILMDGKSLDISFRASKSLVVLVCSPKKGNHFEWGKNAQYLFMGVWSDEEIWAANDLIYKVDPVTVKNRLQAMGHVPLVIFNQPWSDNKIEEGIQTFAQNPLLHHEGCHRVLKIVPNEDYSGYTYGFLSGSLYEQSSEALLAKGKDKVRLFVDAATHPLFATLRGNVYEFPANNALRKGGDFRVRKLNPNGEKVTEETWTLPRHVFQLVPTSQRKPEERTFYLPQRGQGTFDGYLTGPVLCKGAPLFPGESPIYFVQDTVSLSHSKKLEFLTNALKKFGNNYKGVMCFTVPPDIFEDFKIQKWKNHLGNVINDTHDEIPQYVICVPADRILQVEDK